MMRAAVVLFMACTIAGCGKGDSPSSHASVVARINKYELTAEDFRDEMRTVAMSRGAKEDPQAVRARVLDQIVTKKILLEEAQRQNLDKERPFMREIERHWEQALIKLLYARKADELARQITVSDKEVLDEYKRLIDKGDIDIAKQTYEVVAPQLWEDIKNRKLQLALDKWIADLRAHTPVMTYPENIPNEAQAS